MCFYLEFYVSNTSRPGICFQGVSCHRPDHGILVMSDLASSVPVTTNGSVTGQRASCLPDSRDLHLEKRSCQLFYYCVHMAEKTTSLCYVSFYVRCSVFHLGYVSFYVRCSVRGIDLPTRGSRVLCTCTADIVLQYVCSAVRFRMCMREELPSLKLLLT